jgi:hypothetical protein
MPSIRFVTRKPPTTLMVAKAMATTPKMVERVRSSLPAAISAPTMVMPEMALEPDMRGVWSSGGTFEITSKPTKRASTRMVRATAGSSSIRRILRRPRRGP